MHENFGNIRYQVDSKIALLTIDKPQKLNSLTPSDLSDLCRAIMKADGDKDVKVAILTGTGRSFCAGVDIMNLPDLSIADRRLLFRSTLDINKLLLHTEKVTIAAVNGMALGAGFEASLLFDFTVAAESATFGLPEIKVGIYPGTFSPIFLLYLMGRKRANELLLRGKIIKASEAAALGLVNEVVPDEKVIDRAKELAIEILGVGSLPVAMCKARLNSAMRNLLDAEMSRFVELQTLVFNSRDAQEGLNALRTKRKPVFTGE